MRRNKAHCLLGWHIIISLAPCPTTLAGTTCGSWYGTIPTNPAHTILFSSYRMRVCGIRSSLSICVWNVTLAIALQWLLILGWHRPPSETSEALGIAPHLSTEPSFPLPINIPKLSSAPVTTWVIFYHIYTPKHSPERSDQALRIVREQLDQIKESYAAQQHGNNTLVLYTTIGQRILPEVMQSMCGPDLRCGTLCTSVARVCLCAHVIDSFCSSSSSWQPNILW